MSIDVVFQIAAVGIIVAIINQVLISAGRQDQAMLTSLAGLVLVLIWVIQYISQLFITIKDAFNI